MGDHFWEKLSCAFLICLSFLILFTFRDYGLTWDEEVQKTYGEHVLDWYSSLFRDSQALSLSNLYLYGGFFDIIAQLAAKVSPIGVYETRHLINTSFGLLGICTAYRLGSYIYNPAGGFFSALFLTLTPVFYGHLFNNPKDIPFATLFLLALFFTIRSYDSLPRIPWSLIFKIGISVGLAMGIRVAGVMLLAHLAALWAFGFLSQYFLNHKRSKPKILFQFATLAGLLLAVTMTAWVTMLLCWPWAQVSPIENTLKALQGTAHFDWRGTVFFGGHDIPAVDLPWTYLPTWLAISLPEFYFVSLGVGCFLAYRFVSTADKTPYQIGQLIKVGLLAFVFCSPILAAIVLNSTVYDAIRQLLFVLPPLAILAGVSFASLLRSNAKALIKYGFAAVIFLCMSITAIDMIQLHPYQSVYFNRAVAGGLSSASKRFETDYWGSSYKEGARWVILNYRVDTSSKIRVANCSAPFQTGYFFEKDPEARQRFITVPPKQYPHVFLGTTRFKCHERGWGRVLHVVERQGVPLLYIFEVRSPLSATNDEDLDLTSAESPLPDSAFNAIIKMVNTIDKFRPGREQTLDVILSNTSSSVWPALGRNDGKFNVHLGNHWLDESGKTFVVDDGRSELPFDIKPDAEVKMQLTVTAPNDPGDYVLEIDMVQESVAWFTQKGSKTLKLKVRVE
jgi:Dolichyl-phosphate-mannose-protein mannosyltransferase